MEIVVELSEVLVVADKVVVAEDVVVVSVDVVEIVEVVGKHNVVVVLHISFIGLAYAGCSHT